MIILCAAGFLLFLLVLLCIPFSYFFSFEKWRAEIRLSLFFGLLSKKKEIRRSPSKETREPEPVAADSLGELDQALDELDGNVSFNGGKAEESRKKEEIPPSVIEKPGGEKEKDLERNDEKTERKSPSYLAQFRFALDNGLMEKCLITLSKLISHGFPRRWQVEGALGTGEPMETGILCGMAYASLLGAAEEIRWDFQERVFTLKGSGRGRLIPLYVLYILLKLALSKQAREFWHFRRGGHKNG